MSKKILIYGLAFGSMVATLVYLYFVGKLYSVSSFVYIFINLIEIVFIPLMAILLFNYNIRKNNPEQFILGRMIFLGFFLSLMISACGSLMYSYLFQYHNNYIQEFLNYRFEGIEKRGMEQNKTLEEIKIFKNNIKDYYSVKNQLSFNMFLAASKGFLFGALVSYFMKAKMNRPE